MKLSEKEFLEDMQDAIDRIIKGPIIELDELLTDAKAYIAQLEAENEVMFNMLIECYEETAPPYPDVAGAVRCDIDDALTQEQDDDTSTGARP